MKVRYEFDNGEVSVIEVEEQYGELIMESRRAEHAQDVKEHRHCYSLDAAVYEGKDYADKDTVESRYEDSIRDEKIREALSELSPVQRRRLSMYIDGMTLREIAAIEGVDHKNVWKSIDQSKNILKKLLRQG